MRNLVTGKEMKEIDRYAIEETGIPSMVLMERAAFKVAQAVQKKAGKRDRIWSLCGCGNNGADGIAAARILFLQGYKVTVLLAGDREKGSREYLAQISIAEKLGLDMREAKGFPEESCDLLIDALFGVGLDREIQGAYKRIMDFIKDKTPGFTVAVDIPSGIHGDNGQTMGMALKADVTITFGYEKLGTMLYPGKDYAGDVIVEDIGFPPMAVKKTGARYFTMEPTDKGLVPGRPAYSNKGSFGHVLVVAGSVNMSGAAYLSALAAYRMGAGLVNILTVEENRAILQSGLPEAILTVYDPSKVLSGDEDFELLIKKQCGLADVIVLGPGMGRASYVWRLVKAVLTNAYVPVVLDADGLNAVTEHPELTRYFKENIIITPHLGEMSRLTGSAVEHIKTHLIDTAREYADRFGITCVLKDAVTVAALRDGKTYINSSGNSAMAKAGSGDVLTGILAGLLAMGTEKSLAVPLGVYLHGRAGDALREKTGPYSLLARELTEEINSVLS